MPEQTVEDVYAETQANLKEKVGAEIPIWAIKMLTLGVQPKVAAVVGFAVGVKLTTPSLSSMYETSDGFVIARQSVPEEDGVGHEVFYGEAADVRRVWDGMIHSAKLTADETKAANKSLHHRYRDQYGNPALPTAGPDDNIGVKYPE